MSCYLTQTPCTVKYSSVVIHETVCIVPTMVTLHVLEVKAVDVLNVYVTALDREYIRKMLGKEFWDDFGISIIMVRTVYKLKSNGAAFRECLA